MTPAPARTIAGRAEWLAAVDAVLTEARHTLCCADADLAVFGLSTRSAVERLRALLLARRDARIRLLADAGAWLERDAARLRQLQRQFPLALEIRLTAPEDPVGTDRLLLADDRHLLRGLPGRALRGWLTLHDRQRARVARDGFDRRWEIAGHNLPAQPLGL